MISSAKCSTWYAVFLTITVVVIAVNPLSINYSFRKEQYSSHSCHVFGNKLDRG